MYLNSQKNEFVELINKEVNKRRCTENFNFNEEVIKAIKKLKQEYDDDMTAEYNEQANSRDN